MPTRAEVIEQLNAARDSITFSIEALKLAEAQGCPEVVAGDAPATECATAPESNPPAA